MKKFISEKYGIRVIGDYNKGYVNIHKIVNEALIDRFGFEWTNGHGHNTYIDQPRVPFSVFRKVKDQLPEGVKIKNTNIIRNLLLNLKDKLKKY